jgi:hypothetical protein
LRSRLTARVGIKGRVLIKLAIPLVVVATIAGASLVAIDSPAEAISCSITRSKTSTSTSVFNGSCYRVRARIDRYSGGVVTSYYGPADSGASYVSNSNGTNAGNLSNKSLLGTSEIWDGWKSF